MSKSGGNSFVSFITGAVVGAALGILYAPDKGKNTRDKLNFALDKYSEKLQEIIDELIEGKSEPISMAKSEGEKVIADAIQQAEQLKKEVDALRNRIVPKKETEADNS